MTSQQSTEPVNPLHPARTRFARLHPAAYLGVRTVVGLVLAALAAWAFFALADAIPENGTMVRVDMAVATWLQVHGTERGETIFSWTSQLGDTVAGVIVVGAVIVLSLRRDWRRAIALAVTCGAGPLLAAMLKLIFQRARPSFASEFVTGGSWSFPSGHAMNALIIYGAFAYWLSARFPSRRLIIACSALSIVLLVGFSRLYLGVHYLSDVIAGYTAGTVWLIVCITGYRFAQHRRIT